MMDVLKVENISQRYGGLQVLSGISFSLKPGEKVALIGPNGAGKTTLMNVLTGLIPPIAGRIFLLGHDVTKLPSNTRVSFGLARSFQISSLFSHLSLLTNVLLAIQGTQRTRYQMIRRMTAYQNNLSRARELIELVGLWGEKDFPISALSHGKQRHMEIIMALASKPKLLLMDEPSAGLTSVESNHLVEVIHHLVGDTTVLLSAHDMDLVSKVANRIMVLYYGRIIADGPPKEIQADQRVREIYLGIEDPKRDRKCSI
jgi:branched-chain amino acid transport system ATP-binding protein